MRGSWGPFLESPEKPFVELRPACSVKLVFLHVVQEIKMKITATFRASRRLRFEDTKRIRSPEMRPKSFETFLVTRPRALADRQPPVFAHHSTAKNDFSVSNITIANHCFLLERTLQAFSWYEMAKVTDLPNTSSDASLVNQVWALTIQILEILGAIQYLQAARI